MAKKSNTAAKVAISIIALGLVAGALGAATRGFRNWNPETWFNYRGQGHKLLKWDYRLDYSKRVMEFYDYYLKDGKKPDWMD